MGYAELAFPTLDFESEKLKATRNMHNPGLRLIERYAELFENLHRSRQGVLRLGPSPTGHYQSSAHRVSWYPCRLISLSKGVSRILLNKGEITPRTQKATSALNV